jgi:hypothetical protein
MSNDIEEAMMRASAAQRFGATPTASDEEDNQIETGKQFKIVNQLYLILFRTDIVSTRAECPRKTLYRWTMVELLRRQ